MSDVSAERAGRDERATSRAVERGQRRADRLASGGDDSRAARVLRNRDAIHAWNVTEWVMVSSLTGSDGCHVIPRSSVPEARDAAAFLGGISTMNTPSPYVFMRDTSIWFGAGKTAEPITAAQAVALAHELARVLRRAFQ